MTDLVTFGESMLRFSPPDQDRLERVDQLDVHVAGAESNVAVAANRLGLDADFGFEVVLVTRGGEGSLALADGDVHEQGVFEADDHDTVGTGDAFIGGFLARHHDGGSVPEALAYGAATASLKRTVPGDIAVVTPEEVESVLAKGEGSGISR